MSNQVPASILNIVMEVRKRIEELFRQENVKLDGTEFAGATSQERVKMVYKGKEFISCEIKDGLNPVLIADLVVIAANKALAAHRIGATNLQTETEIMSQQLADEANQRIQQLSTPTPDNVIPITDKSKN